MAGGRGVTRQSHFLKSLLRPDDLHERILPTEISENNFQRCKAVRNILLATMLENCFHRCKILFSRKRLASFNVNVGQ